MFKKRATALFEEIREALTGEHELELELNPEGNPKRGSFEIFLKEKLIWSGIGKGPPRKDKFPDPTEMIEKVRDVLKDQ